jgi:amino acid permease
MLCSSVRLTPLCPTAFNEAYTTGGLGRFLAIWSTFTTAAFSIGGPDFIANCAPEAQNPYVPFPTLCLAYFIDYRFFTGDGPYPRRLRGSYIG